MAARAKTLLLLLAALCLPAFAHVPRASVVAQKPHQGVERFAQASQRGPGAANALNAPGFCECLYDEGGRSRSTAKERDAESGLDYFGARYMSSALGRFTSADAPLADQYEGDPQSWNLFGYVRNNPLRYVDPTGRECVTFDDGSQGDDGIGSACAGARLGTAQEVVVSGTAGNLTTAAALNGAFWFNNTVNDSFAFLFDTRPQSLSNTPLSDEFEPYALPASILAALLSKRPTGLKGAGKEIVEEFASFEQARNRALALIGEIGSTRTPTQGKFGSLKGAVTGFTTKVGGKIV